MQLAKPALDVGLYTNQLDPMLAFWQEQAGVPFAELLPVGGGVRQHRHAIGDSVLKINHSRTPIERGHPTGLARLTVYTREVDTPVELLDPDGNEVVLAPSDGNRNLTLDLTVNELAAANRFYGEVLGLEQTGEHSFAAGASTLQLRQGVVAPFDRAGLGYRYMTLQVFDVVADHAAVLAAGGGEGMAPVKLGDVAHISFVLDPDGNWIELSQRKSITGSLD